MSRIHSEHGIATHFIPARRIPELRARLSSLEKVTPDVVDAAIEELHFERAANEPALLLIGEKRAALDAAFSNGSVEQVIGALETFAAHENDVGEWAKITLGHLNSRSPTSLKVALEAVRRGKHMTLAECLQMEMGLATAFVVCFAYHRRYPIMTHSLHGLTSDAEWSMSRFLYRCHCGAS